MKNLKKFSLVSALALTAFMFTPSAGYCGDDDISQDIRDAESTLVKNVILTSLNADRVKQGLAPFPELKAEHYQLVKELTIIGGTPGTLLASTRLRTLPPEVFLCTNLERLNASSNAMTSLPDTFDKLPKLKFASFGGVTNKIKAVPPSLFATRKDANGKAYQSLDQVGFSVQPITTLPSTIAQATSLRQLDLYKTESFTGSPHLLDSLFQDKGIGKLNYVTITGSGLLWPKDPKDPKKIDPVAQADVNKWIADLRARGITIRTQ